MKEANVLRVAYAADDNYAKFLGISMLSLLKSNTDFDRICVYALDCGIKNENQEKLRGIVRQYGREIQFLPMQEKIDSLNLNFGAHKIAVASYARLFLPSVLPPECDRVLYIDCDTIVRHSVRAYWDTEFGNALIAGCQDTVDGFFLQKIDLPGGVPYLNAGILLINLKAWREENLLDQFVQVIRRFDGNVPHHDQGVINAVCRERRVRVSVAYNLFSNLYTFSAKAIRRMYFLDDYYSQQELDAAVSDPTIVHFTSGFVGRPWEENSTHPLREEFWDVVNQSPWKGMALSPDSRKKGVKVFSILYRCLPHTLVEFAYRWMNGLLHLRK